MVQVCSLGSGHFENIYVRARWMDGRDMAIIFFLTKIKKNLFSKKKSNPPREQEQ
jgi:hypothetical protein